ncbi:hypothetical protein FRC10_008130 [Ceratobasidium sp. 414]|nr:hypothetical protein FRC10_008130 [Ceratobasidium sp. 414]
MRAKQLFSQIPVPAQVKLVLAAHAVNVNARHLISHILIQARLTMDKFMFVETERRLPPAQTTEVTLTLCKGIPGQFGLTGRDVCNVLWSQSRGLLNKTVEDFLSPSSDDENYDRSSGSESEGEKKTKTTSDQQSSTVASLVTTDLPALGSTSTSSITAVSTSASSRPSSTSTSPGSPRTTTFSSTSITLSSSFVPATTPWATSTGVENLVKPKPTSPILNDYDSPPSDDEEGPVVARVRARRAKESARMKRGERNVFDREKLRPLSLPSRSHPPSSPPTEVAVDIDESHPDLEAHRRYARAAPITSALLRRSRRRGGSTVEFVPIASRRAVDPKRFIPSRPKRASTVPRRRALTKQDQNDVTVTPIFAPDIDLDDDDQAGPGAINLAGTGKPNERLVAVIVSGLVGPGLGQPSNLASTGNATFGEVELTPGCALALAWPAQVLRDFAREDLAMIGFQVWLLGMSVVAILNESIPHLVAGLFTQALSTGWSAFQMARSSSFRAQYEATIVRGACSGVDVLPEYFSHRTQDEIPIVVLNGIFLATMIGLSWRMCRVYGWQTFKRIGASRVMTRAYRLVLAFSIHLQLAVYFFVTSSALWVDELLNGPVACFAEHRPIYEGVFITSVLLLLPWLILGWIGVRRENKLMMHAFLFISFLFVTAWAAMFASDVYRWTFATWPFFSAMTVVSYVVLVATTGLAVVCRYNFKKVQSQQLLPGAEFSDALPPADPEKVEFPTYRPGGELPTFSVAFGQGGRSVPPSQMFPTAPAPAITRTGSTRGQAQRTAPAGYSVNPYANGSSDFWGDNSTTTTGAGTKSAGDTSSHETFRTAEVDIPNYSLEGERGQTPRELPQWQEIRRSQLPPDFAYPQLRTPVPLPAQPQADNASEYATSTGKFEVLRDGRWVQVDARELYTLSVGTHVSGFSGASWVPGDDAAPLPTRPPLPVVHGYLDAPVTRGYPEPPVARGFVGLPGKNIKPQKDGMGGQAVPGGW